MNRIYDQGGIHLSEDQLLPLEIACPVCLREAIRPCVLVLQDDPRVDLVACGCGCYSASRMPKPEVLEEYYRRYYDQTEETATFDGSERFGAHLYRMLQSSQRSAMRILYFGGGVDATSSRSVAHEFIGRGTERVAISLVDRSASCPYDRWLRLDDRERVCHAQGRNQLFPKSLSPIVDVLRILEINVHSKTGCSGGLGKKRREFGSRSRRPPARNSITP